MKFSLLSLVLEQLSFPLFHFGWRHFRSFQGQKQASNFLLLLLLLQQLSKKGRLKLLSFYFCLPRRRNQPATTLNVGWSREENNHSFKNWHCTGLNIALVFSLFLASFVFDSSFNSSKLVIYCSRSIEISVYRVNAAMQESDICVH